MALRKILSHRNPALHKVCKPVTEFDGKLHRLLDDMRETLIDSNGVGLAAPQIGLPIRVVIVDLRPLAEDMPEYADFKLFCYKIRQKFGSTSILSGSIISTDIGTFNKNE